MERFDEAFGWQNWNSSFRDVEDGFICEINVNIGDNRYISKEDGASRTKIEPVKGGISDAMKRCAVQFGLGRDLYNYPKVMLTGDVKYIPNDVLERLHNMTIKINEGTFTSNVVVI